MDYRTVWFRALLVEYGVWSINMLVDCPRLTVHFKMQLPRVCQLGGYWLWNLRAGALHLHDHGCGGCDAASACGGAVVVLSVKWAKELEQPRLGMRKTSMPSCL